MKLNLWQKVLIGMALGVISGYIFQGHHQFAKPIATIYTNLVYMIVVPTVFFAILYGMTNISDIHTLGRIGLKASTIYLIGTVIAVTIGIAFTSFFKPGIGVNLIGNHIQDAVNLVVSKKTLEEIIINMVPTNPIAVSAAAHTLQIVVFAFILGLA